MQNFGGDGIEKRLRQLGLLVVNQHAHIQQLDLLPHLHGLLRGVELALQPLEALAHPQVVKLNALALRTLLAVPVSGLESVLGAGRLGAKQAVMAVEAIDHGLGHVQRQRGVEPLQQHGRQLRETIPRG